MPEPSESARQAQSPTRVASLQPVERGAQIVVLARQFIESFLFMMPAAGICAFREGFEVGGVPLGDLILLSTGVELLHRKLANRLEHAEAGAVAADHAPVHQRGKGLELGV